MTRIITRTLAGIALLSIVLALSGCSAYLLQGKVVRGTASYVELVYAGDERLDQPGVPGVEVRVTRDPNTPKRHLVAKTRSSGAGEFSIIMEEFGTGWMQEQWLIQGVAHGFTNAEGMLNLPSKNSRWRLLITVAEGVSEPIMEQDQIMQDFERFR